MWFFIGPDVLDLQRLSVMLILAAGMLVTVGACCADICTSCASGWAADTSK